MPLQVTTSVDGARRLTGQMLCYGYLMAATGSFVVSILRSLLGGFLPGFLLLASLCFAAAIIAGRVVGSHAETVAA